MMMKNILLLMFGLGIALSISAQGSVAMDTLTASNAPNTQFSASRQERNVRKSEGDSAYLRNDYAAAIQIYENILKKGEAAEVYYNLGNSYYKVGDIAKAILNYERALLLQPSNVDIRANLDIARSKTIDKVIPVPDIFFMSWVKSLINCLSVDAWAKLGVVSFLFLLVSLYLFFFSQQIAWKKGGFIASVIFLLLVIFSNVFAVQQKQALTERNDAIVLSPSITVRSTPSETGTSLFILHEGHKVEVKDNSMREWKEIRLEDGKVGWVPILAIEVI